MHLAVSYAQVCRHPGSGMTIFLPRTSFIGSRVNPGTRKKSQLLMPNLYLCRVIDTKMKAKLFQSLCYPDIFL